jgi:hemolysin activation/secretion protein
MESSFRYLNGISHENNVTEFSASMHTYLPLFRNPVFVLANKFGYQKSWGKLQFYQYPDLGNNTNLRGYRNNRFRGKSLFYHNIDLRMHLFDWDNNVAPMGIGLVGGYDYGRVWLEEESSKRWHRSQTIGIWFNVLDVIILQPHYSFTEERDLFSFKLGFNF